MTCSGCLRIVFHLRWLISAVVGVLSFVAKLDAGVTIDISANHFETPKHHFTLIDAPGHKDFVPNTITAIASSDVAGALMMHCDMYHCHVCVLLVRR
jgi:translation elongation factor EF-1alpha